MSSTFEIPLKPQAQTFNVALNGTSYKLRVVWNVASSCWVLDIADALGNAILVGLPLATGANLLDQYAYLGLGGALIVSSDGDVTHVPQYAELGVTGHLYFVF